MPVMLIRFFTFILLIFPVISLNAQYDSVYTNIPSSTAVDTGLALRIDIPITGRFENRAPVAIITPGGFAGNGIAKESPGLVNHGFIEIRYNFPGYATGTHHSGGESDFRGLQSLKAVRDVILFALGKNPDTNGIYIYQIVNPVIPGYDNTGLIAYSYGGVTNINAAGVFGEDFPELAWILNWESPVGDGMPNAEAGAWSSALRPFNPLSNIAYNPDNGEWNLESLKYNSDIAIPVVDHLNDTVFGGFYFDFNGDDVVNYGKDFIPYPLVFYMGSGYKAFYSERITHKATVDNIFPPNPPSHIVDYEETKEFWQYRNGDYWIDSLVNKLPDLLFMVTASDSDHVQTAPDHPHVLNQYKKFGNASAKFLRINPDSSYVSYILGYNEPAAKDNDAYAVYNHLTIRDCFEPGGKYSLLGKAVSVPAGACELADRKEYNIYTPQLDGVISSVKENSFMEYPVTIYPNPFKNSFTINGLEYFGENQLHLSITNINGKEIYKKSIKAYMDELTINIPDITSGLYFLFIYSDSRIFFKKEIISL